MKKRASPSKTAAKKTAVKNSKTSWVIGRSFEKISAVEGIALTGDMRKRADRFVREGLPVEERRRAIIKAYRKA